MQGGPGGDLSHAIGAGIRADGAIGTVRWDGPAFRAGLHPGTSVVAVGDLPYSGSRPREAVTAAVRSKEPIVLPVKDADRIARVAIDYHGGLRYPRLEKLGTGETGIDRLPAPRTMEASPRRQAPSPSRAGTAPRRKCPPARASSYPAARGRAVRTRPIVRPAIGSGWRSATARSTSGSPLPPTADDRREHGHVHGAVAPAQPVEPSFDGTQPAGRSDLRLARNGASFVERHRDADGHVVRMYLARGGSAHPT